MDAKRITAIIDGWYELTKAAEKAMDADSSLIDEGDRWLPRMYASDIESLDVLGDSVYGYGLVWTLQTGGSFETVNFTIPLDTLNKYL